MDKLKCAIVDDEPLAIEILEEYAKKVPWLRTVFVSDSGLEALEYIMSNKIDLVLLDIQMPELSGIHVAELLKGQCHIIFTTAYNQYAVEGFELQAMDYLLKPISFERFLKAINRLKNSQIQMTLPPVPDYIFIKSEYKMKKVSFCDIVYVEGMKDYLRIVTRNEKIMTLMSFSKLMCILPNEAFVRIHKSYIVAVTAINSVEKGKVEIGEKWLPIGESYRESFFDLIGKRAV